MMELVCRNYINGAVRQNVTNIVKQKLLPGAGVV